MEADGYRVVVRGRLSERLASAFRDVTLRRQADRTVLTGRADEARLETVLARLGDLGIEPVSVERDD